MTNNCRRSIKNTQAPAVPERHCSRNDNLIIAMDDTTQLHACAQVWHPQGVDGVAAVFAA